MFFPLSCGRMLFQGPAKYQDKCWQPLLFSQRWSWSSHLWSLPGLLFGPAFSFSICQSLFSAPPWGVCTESQSQCGVVCAWGTQCTGGSLWASCVLGDLQVRHSYLSMDGLLDEICDAFSRICEPYLQLSQPLSTLQSRGLQFSTLDGVREKWAPLAVSCTSGEARCSCTHSPFPLQEKSWAKRPFLAISCAASG